MSLILYAQCNLHRPLAATFILPPANAPTNFRDVAFGVSCWWHRGGDGVPLLFIRTCSTSCNSISRQQVAVCLQSIYFREQLPHELPYPTFECCWGLQRRADTITLHARVLGAKQLYMLQHHMNGHRSIEQGCVPLCFARTCTTPADAYRLMLYTDHT